MAKYLSNIDLSQNQLLNSVLQNLATAPPSPREGQMYYNTAVKRAYICINPVGPEWLPMDALSAVMSAADIVNAINGSALIIDNDNLSAAVNDAIAKAHNAHTIDMITGLQTALNAKAALDHDHIIGDVTGLQAALDAKSATTHNHTLDGLSNTTITANTSGEILKWNGTAWVNNTLAEAGIAPASHNHTIAQVTDLQSALDGKVDDSQVLTNVPAGAVFTDTVTTINGKTGVIAKADIVALGIPAQDTTYAVFNSTTNGLTPLSGGGTTKYLRADGTWVVPPNTVYTLPVAGAAIGGVRSGTDITVDASGNVSVNDDSHNHIISNVDGLQAALDAKETPAGALAKATTAENNAKAYTDTHINEIIGAAPGTLDTLNELAAALGDDPNFATTIANQMALKTDKYSVAIGNGSLTSFTVTHGLNSRDVVVMVRETGAPYAQVITDVEMATVDTITVKFAVAPTASQYTVTVIG